MKMKRDWPFVDVVLSDVFGGELLHLNIANATFTFRFQMREQIGPALERLADCLNDSDQNRGKFRASALGSVTGLRLWSLDLHNEDLDVSASASGAIRIEQSSGFMVRPNPPVSLTPAPLRRAQLAKGFA